MLVKIKEMILNNYIIIGIYNRLANRVKIYSGGDKNSIDLQSGLLTRCKIEIIGRENKIIIGNGARINNSRFFIRGNHNVIKIASDAIICNGDFCIEDDKNEIVVGERTAICGKTHLACIEGTKILIGTDCLFSSDIIFRTGDSHSILDDNLKRINHSQDIVIEDHVWVCNRVMVGKGVTIRSNSVIGMGAVVISGSDKTNVILAGVPAHIVKENINWKDIRI